MPNSCVLSVRADGAGETLVVQMDERVLRPVGHPDVLVAETARDACTTLQRSAPYFVVQYNVHTSVGTVCTYV